MRKEIVVFDKEPRIEGGLPEGVQVNVSGDTVKVSYTGKRPKLVLAGGFVKIVGEEVRDGISD